MRTHTGRCVSPRAQQLVEVCGRRRLTGFTGDALRRFLVQIEILFDIALLTVIRRPLIIALILKVLVLLVGFTFAFASCLVLLIAFISLVATQLRKVIRRSILLLHRHTQAVSLLICQLANPLRIQLDLRNDADQQFVDIMVEAARRLNELTANLLGQFSAG